MILWFTIVQIVIAIAAGLFCLGAGFAGRRPATSPSARWLSSRCC